MGSGHEGTIMGSSPEQTHGGKMAGKLDYRTDPDKGKYGLCYVEVNRVIPLPDESKRIGLWVYGDNSGNNLSVRIQDFNKEIFQYNMAKKIDWSGWKYLEVTICKPDSKFNGVKNGVIDYPITFQGVLIGIVPKRKTAGTVFLDDLTVRYNEDRFRR